MILTMPFKHDHQVNFDCLTGEVTAEINDAISTGNMHCVAGHNIALYAQQGLLKLQIDSRVWAFTTAELKISFHHNVANRTSHFAVASPAGNFTLEYPAWWAAIPDFEPVEPEMDEDEDYLAYIYTVWKSPSIQQSLLKKWRS